MANHKHTRNAKERQNLSCTPRWSSCFLRGERIEATPTRRRLAGSPQFGSGPRQLRPCPADSPTAASSCRSQPSSSDSRPTATVSVGCSRALRITKWPSGRVRGAIALRTSESSKMSTSLSTTAAYLMEGIGRKGGAGSVPRLCLQPLFDRDEADIPAYSGMAACRCAARRGCDADRAVNV